MMLNRSLIRRAAILMSLAACAATALADAPPMRGKLLIIGGGVTSKNGPTIYKTLADATPAVATIGIIPTASGVPAQAGKSATSQISKQAGDRKVVVIDIRPEDKARADDLSLVRQIDACGGIFFTGGQQDRILEAFRSGEKPTAIYQALEHILDRNGIISGSSAGAAIMSDPMIYGGTSNAAWNGSPTTKPGLPMGKGMGFFPFGVVDQHFLQRGRFGRLIIALEETNQNFGFGISEDRALLVDRASGLLTTIGTEGVVFIDRREAKRDGKSRTNLRVSLLGNGDTIDGRSGALTLEGTRTARPVQSTTADPLTVDKAWARFAIRDLLRELAANHRSKAVALDRGYEFRFSVDDRTAFHVGKADADDVSIVNARLDIVPRDQPDTRPTTQGDEVTD